MLDIAVRLIAAFMAHNDHGVNAMAQSLPRTNLGGLPDDEAPPVVPVYNDSDHSTVADNLTPPEVPALVVWGDSNIDVSLRGYKIAKEVIIAAAFITGEGVDPLVTNRACGYILRGGLLTMGRYNNQSYSQGLRELNGVRIHEVKSVTEQRVTAAVGRNKMWGFLDIRAVVVETLS